MRERITAFAWGLLLGLLMLAHIDDAGRDGCEKKWNVHKCERIYAPESEARRIENLQPGAFQ